MRILRWFSHLPLRVQGALWGLLCAGLLLGLGRFHIMQGLERATLDALFQARGQRYPSPQVAIVVFDDDAAARYGTWPPRRLYTQVVRRLRKAGARTIAFDIMFAMPSDRPAEDAEFARVCAQFGHVLHPAAFRVPNGDDALISSKASGIASTSQVAPPQKRFAIDSRGAECKIAAGAFSVRPELQSGAAAIGHINVFPELSDGALRRIPHLIRWNGDVFPSLALSTSAHALGLKSRDIVASNHEVRVGQRRIPLDAQGEILVNWIGGNHSFATYSFNQVLSQPEARLDEAFKDRVVIIGATSTGAFEHHATPFSPSQPAVELQANAVDDILTGRLLHQASELWQLFGLLMLTTGAGCLIGGRNARFSAGATLALAVMVWMAALYFFRSHNFYWPIGTPLLAMLATVGCCLSYQQLRDAYGLKMAEERYALAVRGANDGIWDWNLKTDSIYYSPRWKSIVGCEEHEISQQPDEWFGRVHSADREMVQRHLSDHLEGRAAQFKCEFRIGHRDGSFRWVLSRGLMVRDRNQQAARMAGSLSDITERHQAEDKLIQQALTDELTNLPNRTLFMDRLARAIGRSHRRDNYSFAILFLDLDRFKVVNDSLGHLVGDEMLQIVARRLETCLRPGDTVARLGGDEFTMLIDDIDDASDAIAVAERVQSTLGQPLQLAGHNYSSAASIGIAVATCTAGSDGRLLPHYGHADDLLRDADTAMYRAKSLGRGRHVVFDEEMHRHAMSMLHLETELRRALEREHFRVFYQPIIDMNSQRISGFEALVRWQDPERGLVPPSEFIAFAEETGIIIALDQWVLRQACRQTRLWQTQLERDDLTISVNLSGKQFEQAGLVKLVEETLRDTDLSPSSLRLEITEGVIMQNAEASAQMLTQLKTLGVRLSIDDFGTGYSSLSYLHQFPLDVLKVDRSFVMRMGAAGENAAIVETILGLARNLEMRVVAEGIESQHQFDLLCEMGCNYGQGYLFSRPVDAQAATELLIHPANWSRCPAKVAALPSQFAVSMHA